MKPDPRYHRTILELQPHDCRYMIGEPNGVNTLFCANPQIYSSAYCAYHHRLTHVPTTPAKYPPKAQS